MDQPDRPIQLNRETLLLLHGNLAQLEQEIGEFSARGHKIAQRTRLLVRVVLFLVILSALATFSMLKMFSDRIGLVVDQLGEMYQGFDRITMDMRHITELVGDMQQNTTGLPRIEHSMASISGNVHAMEGNVTGMTNSIQHMDTTMFSINTGVGEMANRFDYLTRTLDGVHYNVNQMSQPVKTAPFPFP